MSKKLPRATSATLDGIREEAAPAAAKASRPAAARKAPRPAAARKTSAAKAPPSPEPEAPPSAAASPTENELALRRAHARETVERYTAYAAVGGLIPLPFLDTLGVMATIGLMIQAVAEIYGQPLRRETARTLAASVAGGLGQAGAGAATASVLAKLTPGANVAGIMVSSAAAAAMAHTIGRAFILHFETGGTALRFDAAAIAAYFAANH